ncbi:MAG TPA: cbb3-type cytochrome c oxidase subunit 3 [Marinobacter sp.]|jgi:cytochrome c oxidase cbb3-type subunit 4|nr:cbb3-type cytochrome c oxidase subunit 3 [Marinobacter sp.]
MDMNDVRGIHTLLVMAAFFGIVWWAYSAHRRKANEEAAHLPFDDEVADQRTREREQAEKKQ